jgi:site-specific recombinase XerD
MWTLIGDIRRELSHGRESGYWCARWRLDTDPKTKVRQVRLCRDKRESTRMLSAVLDRKAAELVQPIGEYATHSLSDHIDDYIAWHRQQGHAERHIGIVRQRITEVCKEQGITQLEQITPNKIERFLARHHESGRLSDQSLVHWRAAIKAFCHWCEREDRMAADPLRKMKAKSIKGDIVQTFKRRAMGETEFSRLISSVVESTTRPYYLTGMDRATIYMVAYNTGLRASEVRSLTPGSFDLDAWTVLIECSVSKRRRYDTIHLPESLVEWLRDYLADRPETEPIWPGSWHRSIAEILRADLVVAGIEPETAKGRVDFHAMRHSYATNVCKMKISPIVMQRACRFSTPALLNRYGHIGAEELKAVASALPKVKTKATTK